MASKAKKQNLWDFYINFSTLLLFCYLKSRFYLGGRKVAICFFAFKGPPVNVNHEMRIGEICRTVFVFVLGNIAYIGQSVLEEVFL